MSRPANNPPKSIRIELTPNEKPSNAQEAAEYYLTSGEVNPRHACREALVCLFSPLGTALAGGSQTEVEAAIAASRPQFEIFMALAQNRSRKSNDQLAQASDSDELLDLENESY